MSTTVKYKGNTLATVSNATKTLKTAGKYMEGDVQLTDVSSTIVISETYDTNGGIIKTITTTGDTTNLQAKTVTPSTTNQTINPDSGYVGMSQVVVEAAPSSSAMIESLSVTPSESAQTFNASGVDGYKPVSVSAISSTYVGSGIARRSDTDLTVSDATVTIPAGYYSTNTSKTIPTAVIDDTSVRYSWRDGQFTISNNVSTPGYINHNVFSHVLPNEISGITLVTSETITPTESTQVVADKGTFVISNITVDAISSTYVGTGITRRSSTDLTVSGATVTAPAGYYSAAASKSVATMTLPTAAASSATSGYTSKATIGRSTAAQYINIPPGYNSAGAYYVISAVANGSATAPASISGTAANVSTGNGTLTLTKTISVTPSVTAGYVSSGTAGNSSVSLTANVTINPTPTASGATVTIPAGYYTEATSKAVTTMTLPTSAASSATSGYTKKATISRSTSTQYINIAPGYNSAGGYYEISAVANGSATGPSSLSGTSATVSTGTNTLTLTKTGVTTTPTVTAGYVSSATASTATVTLTASVTTKAAATITPTTTNQTIAAGTYLTGTQTIAGDADLVGSNILSTANIFGVQGTVDFIDVYIRSAAPTSSVGSDGDIYIQE